MTTSAGFLSQTTKGRQLDTEGARRVYRMRFQMSDSYPTGGEACDPKTNGCPFTPQTVKVFPRGVAATHGAAGATLQYDYTNKKLLAFCGSAESAAGTDLSGITVDVEAISE